MGKGDWRRPTLVDERAAADNWCASFGHRLYEDRCLTCGVVVTQDVNQTESDGK